MKKLLVLALIICFGAAVQAGEEGKKSEEKVVTKEKYMAKMQKRAERKGKEFDPAKAEASFAKKDVNNDGVLSGEENAKKKKPTKPEAE